MAIITCMDGEEQFTFELDTVPSLDDLWNVECIAIEKAIGSVTEDTPQTEILSGIVWVLAKRQRPTLRWSDFRFRMGDVTPLLAGSDDDDGEVPKENGTADAMS